MEKWNFSHQHFCSADLYTLLLTFCQVLCLKVEVLYFCKKATKDSKGVPSCQEYTSHDFIAPHDKAIQNLLHYRRLSSWLNKKKLLTAAVLSANSLIILYPENAECNNLLHFILKLNSKLWKYGGIWKYGGMMASFFPSSPQPRERHCTVQFYL